MYKLGLSTFLSGTQDMETRQYLVLSGLKKCYDEFVHNKLYPTLKELIDLHAALIKVVNGMEDIQSYMPQELKEVDIKRGKLIYESSIMNDGYLEQVTQLIRWSIPKIRQMIDEGIGIYNFVDGHMHIDQVGVIPIYRKEGYWFVPDLKTTSLHLLRYKVSSFASSNERYSSLNTTHIDNVEQGQLVRSPESIKLDLIKKFRDLPNPATYICHTDLDFPYTETIFPVGKRKLLSHILKE